MLLNLIRIESVLFKAAQPLVILCAVLAALPLLGQNNISINATGDPAHPSAILDVSSTSSGMLLPRMTEAERDAIVSPVNGLVIFQTDGDEGFWYWDGGASVPFWRKMPRYLGASIEMGADPSTILHGSGFTVTRLIEGVDQVDFNVPFGAFPYVMISNSDALGAAPVLGDYCDISFNSCDCHHIRDLRVWSGLTAGTGDLLIDNLGSDCNDQPGRNIFYPPGDPVYAAPSTDLCQGSPDRFSIELRGNNPTTSQPPTCGFQFTKVYIDWQQDGFFDEMDDRVVNTPQINWSLAGPDPVGYSNLLIPNGTVAPDFVNAYNGETFMRAWTTPNVSLNSCPGGSQGETEDYVVSVSCRIAPVYEDVPTYCNPGDFTNSAFRISCRRLGGEPRNVKNYYFQVNEQP